MECDHLHVARVKEGALSASRSVGRLAVAKIESDGVSIRPRNGARLAVVALDKSELRVERICMTSTGSVLVVSPEVVWLTESNGYSADFDVVSNVDWNIE